MSIWKLIWASRCLAPSEQTLCSAAGGMAAIAANCQATSPALHERRKRIKNSLHEFCWHPFCLIHLQAWKMEENPSWSAVSSNKWMNFSRKLQLQLWWQLSERIEDFKPHMIVFFFTRLRGSSALFTILENDFLLKLAFSFQVKLRDTELWFGCFLSGTFDKTYWRFLLA